MRTSELKRTLELHGRKHCTARVWSNGDKEDCGRQTEGGELCAEHLAEEVKRLQEHRVVLETNMKECDDKLAALLRGGR